VQNMVVTGNAELGSAKATDAPTMLEMSCPEYFVTTIGRVEPAGGDNLRLYMCVRKGDVLEPMFSVVMPLTHLAQSARLALVAAAAHHTELEMDMRDLLTAH
jgi:hypothetical protein